MSNEFGMAGANFFALSVLQLFGGLDDPFVELALGG
jgi:hypothetical protein